MNKDEFIKTIEGLRQLRPQHPRHSWKRNCYEVQQHVKRGDDTEGFIRWSTIRGTMFLGETKAVENEYNSLLERGLMDRYEKAVKEHSFGDPVYLTFDENTSGNLIHQAYHLSQFEHTFEKKVEELETIVEFGGGYGAMCAVIRRLGFSGEYALYDLPEFRFLQEYYLSNIDINYENNSYHSVDEECRFAVPPRDVDLLIACYSLSEAPEKVRKPFIDATNAKYILIIHQGNWDKEGTTPYFDKLMNDRDHLYDWTVFKHPYFGSSRYVLGKHK